MRVILIPDPATNDEVLTALRHRNPKMRALANRVHQEMLEVKSLQHQLAGAKGAMLTATLAVEAALAPLKNLSQSG